MPMPRVANIVSQLNTSTAAPYRRYADMKASQCEKIGQLKTALVAHGFDSVSKQAAILGLSRSTAWKVLKSDHKHSGLTANTINRMLASTGLPPEARKVIEEYVCQKLGGAYGHGTKPLETFRQRLRYQTGGPSRRFRIGTRPGLAVPTRT
jgi:hypothetical protein